MNQSEPRGKTRLNIVPEQGFVDLQSALAGQLERIASRLHAPEFASLLDPLMRQTIERGFTEAGAHEGTIWLLDQEGQNLVPAHNTGPEAGQLLGSFKQPLNSGLICMVFASEQPFLENEVWKNSGQSKLVDELLSQQTCAMIAVPFYFLRGCRGVVSCVQLKRQPEEPFPSGFQPEHLLTIQRATAMLSQLVEYRLLSDAVGWSSL